MPPPPTITLLQDGIPSLSPTLSIRLRLADLGIYYSSQATSTRFGFLDRGSLLSRHDAIPGANSSCGPLPQDFPSPPFTKVRFLPRPAFHSSFFQPQAKTSSLQSDSGAPYEKLKPRPFTLRIPPPSSVRSTFLSSIQPRSFFAEQPFEHLSFSSSSPPPQNCPHPDFYSHPAKPLLSGACFIEEEDETPFPGSFPSHSDISFSLYLDTVLGEENSPSTRFGKFPDEQ